MDDNDKLLYLLSVSSIAIPEAYVNLRSYYNLHFANVARKQNIELPNYLNSQNFTCSYCYSPWDPDTSSFKLLPAKKLSADEKRKNKSDMSIDENEIREASLPKNKLVLTCKICKNKTSIPLKKKSKTSEVNIKVEEKAIVTKKKKKKDKACGLNPKFVTSLQKTKTQSTTPAINQKNKRSLNNSKTAQNNCLSSIKSLPKLKVPALNKNKNQNSMRKKLVINPHAFQNQHKIAKKNKKRHEQLIQAVKEDKSVRNTLKGFLSLISR